MKKNIFLILVSILFVFVLIYFYDRKELIINKEYTNDNIYIEYPYFNNKIIDNYINNYLNSKIEEYTTSNIFIDYDYYIEDSIVNLSIYTYMTDNNKVSSTIKNIEINIDTLDINIKDSNSNTTKEYYAYSNTIIDNSKPMIALTFDDGPNHNTSRILDILNKYNIKATFFILGCNIEGNESVIEKMYEYGMEIGNHTYSHKLLTNLTKDEIESEFSVTDNLIFSIINNYPTLIRTSYGTINKKIKSLVNRPIILWDIDTLDWKYHNSSKISNNILKKVSDGDIILMHDIYTASANSLDIFIPKLLEEGYQFVTVTELFYYKNISLNSGVTYGSAK